MILLQAWTVAALGFAIGTGMAATFFEITFASWRRAASS